MEVSGNLMGSLNTVLVSNAERMMLSATVQEDGIGLTFADGCRGVVPFADLPEVEGRSEVLDLELPNPYEVILTTSFGERVELPWDFARHFCDRSYRPMVEAIAQQGRQTLGERIRRLRESAGLTQRELASSAGIGRVTVVRLENGEQTPRYVALEAIAGSLGRAVQDLVHGDEVVQ